MCRCAKNCWKNWQPTYPQPRLNLVRYHRVLAPNAADRDQIVPGPQEQTQNTANSTGKVEVPSAPRSHRWTP